MLDHLLESWRDDSNKGSTIGFVEDITHAVWNNCMDPEWYNSISIQFNSLLA